MQDPAPDEFRPLTRQEVQKLRQTVRCWSPWMVIGGQLLAGLLTVCLVWGLTGLPSVALSALYGVLTVLVPATLFARAMTRKLCNAHVAAAVASFLLWEFVKLALSVMMMWVAPRIVTDLSWPALLIGLVVTMKAVWLVIWLQLRFEQVKKTKEV